MTKKFTPIPYNLFPNDVETINGTNCLAFALGICKPRYENAEYELDSAKSSIEAAFLEKVQELGFNPKKFRRIREEDEEKVKGYVIRVYDFANIKLADGTTVQDFHVIRREPNGQWVHKPGFGYEPREISIQDWRVIFWRYGISFVSFAIKV